MGTERSAAVLFDADGVIQQTPVGWWEAWAEICPDSHRVDEFREDLFMAERPFATLASGFEEAVAGVLDRWGCPERLADTLAMWEQLDPEPASLEIVRAAREGGSVVALATNQQHVRARYMRTTLGYERLFDHLFFSCEMGVSKPSAAYFMAIAERLGVTPRDLLFIDDSVANCEAAAAAGLVTGHYHLQQGPDALRKILAG